jgi:hypothetical protein
MSPNWGANRRCPYATLAIFIGLPDHSGIELWKIVSVR